MNYPYNTVAFIAAWTEWLQYKVLEHRFRYKSKKSEQRALNNLYKISGGNEADAIEIINKSIANGYQGLFPLKNSSNGAKYKTSSGRYTATGEGGY